MAHEFIATWGYRTGALQTSRTIRNGLCFDLSHVDLSNRVVLAASLYLRDSSGNRQVSSVRLSDPTGRCEYGRLSSTSTPDTVHASLNADALAELQEAGGAFFQVHATVEDTAGDALRLGCGSGDQVLILAVASAVAASAA